MSGTPLHKVVRHSTNMLKPRVQFNVHVMHGRVCSIFASTYNGASHPCSASVMCPDSRLHSRMYELEVLCNVLTKERKDIVVVVEDRHHGICARSPGTTGANVCRQPKCSCRRYVRRCLLVLTATVYTGKNQLASTQ